MCVFLIENTSVLWVHSPHRLIMTNHHVPAAEEMTWFSHQLSVYNDGNGLKRRNDKRPKTANADEKIASWIFLITTGAFRCCRCRWGEARHLTPPAALLLNSSLPSCACLVFLHFSLSVSDLASFLLSLFHSDSPDGKLISTV